MYLENVFNVSRAVGQSVLGAGRFVAAAVKG